MPTELEHPTEPRPEAPHPADEPAASAGEITQLLQAARSGRRAALDALVPLIYQTLRQIARRTLARERPGHTLSTTALAHEAYVRLAGLERIDWRDRAHFFAAAAGAMRRVLVDHAVARRAQKRGSGIIPTPIDEARVAVDDHLDGVLVVNDALLRLEAVHAGAVRIVECRVFMGMTVEETAEAVGLSPATVKRHWTAARAWLARALADRGGDGA
jgi:RNA polymerase sigma factor (TIGR02999 family)